VRIRWFVTDAIDSDTSERMRSRLLETPDVVVEQSRAECERAASVTGPGGSQDL